MYVNHGKSIQLFWPCENHMNNVEQLVGAPSNRSNYRFANDQVKKVTKVARRDEATTHLNDTENASGSDFKKQVACTSQS